MQNLHRLRSEQKSRPIPVHKVKSLVVADKPFIEYENLLHVVDRPFFEDVSIVSHFFVFVKRVLDKISADVYFIA